MPDSPMIGPVSKTVGVNIDRIRKARGVSVNHLGACAGVHRTAITNVIHGRRRVDADELVALAAALDVSVAQLLGIDGAELVLIPAVTVTLASAEVS